MGPGGLDCSISHVITPDTAVCVCVCFLVLEAFHAGTLPGCGLFDR